MPIYIKVKLYVRVSHISKNFNYSDAKIQILFEKIGKNRGKITKKFTANTKIAESTSKCNSGANL